MASASVGLFPGHPHSVRDAIGLLAQGVRDVSASNCQGCIRSVPPDSVAVGTAGCQTVLILCRNHVEALNSKPKRIQRLLVSLRLAPKKTS